VRNDQTHWETVFSRKWLTIMISGKKYFVAVEIGDRDVGGVALLGMDQNIISGRLGPNAA